MKNKNFFSKEYFSLSALNFIINNFFMLTKVHKKMHEQYMKILLNLKKDLDKTLSFDENGFCIKMRYSNSNSIGGRLFAEKQYSLQRMERRIRGALVLNDKSYHDIDMVNAQFNIIVFYCKKNNIKHELLKDYVENRDEIFKKFFSDTSLSRDDFKQNFCRVTFYGRKVTKKHLFFKNECFKEYFLSFKKEIRSIFDQIIFIEKDLYDLHKTRFKKQNKKASFSSLFLQNIEKEILLNAIEILKKFLCLNNNYFVLIHDGFMLPKFLLSSEKSLNMVLQEINRKLETHYNYPFIFSEKFMNNSIFTDKDVEKFFEEDNLMLKAKIDFSEKNKRQKKLRLKILDFVSNNIFYDEVKTNMYTIKNVLWLFQNEFGPKVKNIHILNSLRSLKNFKPSVKKKVQGVLLFRHYFSIKSKDKRILFLFDQIKNKNNLSEKEKIIIIEKSKTFNYS